MIDTAELTLSLAKSKMENEEGLNYLRVAWTPFGKSGIAVLRIGLPPEIRRKPNLSGFDENEGGLVTVYQPDVSDEVVFELYTVDPVPCGRSMITAEIVYKPVGKSVITIARSLTLEIAAADSMEGLAIDQGVVDCVERLGRPDPKLLIVDACYDPRARRRRLASDSKPDPRSPAE